MTKGKSLALKSGKKISKNVYLLLWALRKGSVSSTRMTSSHFTILAEKHNRVKAQTRIIPTHSSAWVILGAFNIQEQTDGTLARCAASQERRNYGIEQWEEEQQQHRCCHTEDREGPFDAALPLASLLFSQAWEGKQQYILALRAQDCFRKKKQKNP